MTITRNPTKAFTHFSHRHIGTNSNEQQAMLKYLNLDSLTQLIAEIVPKNIQLTQPLCLPEPKTEAEILIELKQISEQNKIFKNYLGQGYYGTHTPSVIQRQVLENPNWYTAYTPYQAEISQGRLEALFFFQQMIVDLTAMDIANASLLDEATAAAEAMALCFRCRQNKNEQFFVSDDLHPQTIAVLTTRAKGLGIDLIIDNPKKLEQCTPFGALFGYPNTTGHIKDLKPMIEQAQQRRIKIAISCDLLALTLLTPPGEWGVDVVIGSAQRFGIPMGFGGPHAAFIATKKQHKRQLPGRIIGLSQDKYGNPAYRMALQTREQHIRRDKATSNICTSQALLANIAAFYAMYHGPEGLKNIAQHIHYLTCYFADEVVELGWLLKHTHFFDTLTIITNSSTEHLYKHALEQKINVRKKQNHICLSFDEITTIQDINALLALFKQTISSQENKPQTSLLSNSSLNQGSAIPKNCLRNSNYLTHPCFHQYRSETQLLRYIEHLARKDYSLTDGMIPLGSCTMKLNAATEMRPISWEHFNQLHPFAPSSQTQGYQRLITELSADLCKITGYDAVSLQPNAGAQGEYAGLICIQNYHQQQGQPQRNVCFIPSSAHGTNPASANLLSMKIVVIHCDEQGNIDITDLETKIEQYQNTLSCIMITYPSTHGVYEPQIQSVCEKVHQAGGQVYLDGANMNAQVGLTNPAIIGADVSHLNLHKTFCIPHGGGGPGVGPIGVKSHLASFLPSISTEHGNRISGAPYGSASILPISYAYIRMMGAEGLKNATQAAILNANYIAEQLKPHYSILYTGNNQRVAHECIVDLRPLKMVSGITEEDVAKRLIDYGFHAPTMSFPVIGTLMIEPTESENKAELDRFCQAMIQIRHEIDNIIQGEWALDNNPLINAPHTQVDMLLEPWPYAYSKQIAFFPNSKPTTLKFWASVNRVDNVHGDRHLICQCADIKQYQD